MEDAIDCLHADMSERHQARRNQLQTEHYHMNNKCSNQYFYSAMQ